MRYRVIDGSVRVKAARLAGMKVIRGRVGDVEVDIPVEDLEIGYVSEARAQQLADHWSPELESPIEVEPV